MRSLIPGGYACMLLYLETAACNTSLHEPFVPRVPCWLWSFVAHVKVERTASQELGDMAQTLPSPEPILPICIMKGRG